MQLRVPGKSVRLAPVNPNAGVRSAYARRLLGLVSDMHDAIEAKLLPIFRDVMKTRASTVSDAITFDYATESQLFAVMEQVAKEWRATFV